MTPRGKLTKWDEWEIGQEYESCDLYWEKAVYRLEEINRKEGWILLRRTRVEEYLPSIQFRAWRNRFRKVEQ